MIALPALSALLAATLSLEAVAVNPHGALNNVHRDLAHKRQVNEAAAAPGASTTSSPSATGTTAAAASSAASVTSAAAPAASSAAAGASSVAAAPAGSAGAGTGVYDIPPLASITMGMPSGAIPSLTTTYTPGATPTYIKGAPALPSKFVFSGADWPALDKLPPTDSTQVKEWLKELDGHDIPNITPLRMAPAQAQERAWWTCGAWTAKDDIVACPDKLTWGVSYDDGPSPYSAKLLRYLEDKNLSATFFVVGSRVVSYPDILIDEYMSGHEIAVHTWSHPHLTSLTNEEIVAELGWSRHAIQQVLGITPRYMRAPYGDLDNRVRAISHAMGMTPIIWTNSPAGPFDTNDWHVPGGQVTGEEQLKIFEALLGNATTLDTGFIVLEHDLYEQTVDLAVGYLVDAALKHQPPFTLKAIGECMGFPATDFYVETNTNTSSSSSSDGQHSSSAAAGGGSDSSGASPRSTSVLVGAAVAAAVAFAGLL
ncbi:hypothetical protein C8Q78DRAFT_1066502 [Trametes maxima]|nr:hypothetical protein C8Q78DRAFT_1066502 [Trametes maxima]